jgi:hypothetical protein
MNTTNPATADRFQQADPTKTGVDHLALTRFGDPLSRDFDCAYRLAELQLRLNWLGTDRPAVEAVVVL